MNGWNMVYIIVCIVNGITISTMGYGWQTPQYWITLACVIIAYISGREVGP